MAPVHQTQTWACPACGNGDLQKMKVNRSWRNDSAPIYTFGSTRPAADVGPATMLIDFECLECHYAYAGEQEGFVNQQRAFVQQQPVPAGQGIQNGRTRAINGRADPVMPELTPAELEAERQTRISDLLDLRRELGA